MPITTSPFTLTNTSLVLTPTAGVETEYRCQLTQAQLTPSTTTGGGGNEVATFCTTHSSGGAGALATWTLDLAGFQAYADATDLTMFLYEHEGEKLAFTLTPIGPDPISATNPGFTGEVTATPTQVGGTAQQYATFTVSLPVSAKPLVLKTPPAAVFDTEQQFA